MILHRLKSIIKNQRGVAVLELLIATLITGVVTGGITMSILQVFDGNARSSTHMIVVRQAQNAGYWISRDAQMAETVTTTGVSGFPLTLTWTEYAAPSDAHQIVYTLLTDNKLQRSHYVNGVPSGTTIVAQNIDPDNTNFQFGGGGSYFSLPDGSVPQDTFTITDPVGGDSGIIYVDVPEDVTKATPVGGATVDGGTDPVIINISSGGVAWATPVAGSMITLTNTSNSDATAGSWTSTTGTAKAIIIIDSDSDATLANGNVLILTITVTAGTDSLEASETRVYEITPRISS